MTRVFSPRQRLALVRHRRALLALAVVLATASFTACVAPATGDPVPAVTESAGLQLTGTTTASSTESSSYVSSNATDGNLSTRWSSAFSDPQWIQMDLGTVQPISEVKLYWENAYATAFQIQVSNDGATWTAIENVTSGAGGTNDFTGLSASGRYVRMYGTHRATPYGYSLWEFQVFSGATTAPGGGTTQFMGTATASSLESSAYPAAYGADGNLSTRWSSAFSDPQWIQLDLGAVQPISEVKLYWENAYATAFQIQVSNDGTTWTAIENVTSGTGGTNDFTGLSASGRYVRMYGTQRATPYGYSLWEFQVSGPAGTTSGDGGTVATDSGDGSTGGTSTACKRGIAYGQDSVADLTALAAGGRGISWWYNWALTPDPGISPSTYTSLGVDFVPMQWGGTFSVANDESAIPSAASWLLGFNEPEDNNQTGLTPQQAAALWPQVEQIAAARHLKLVSPAVNYCGGNCNETNPFTWLNDFFSACTGCQVDAIAVHWYSCYTGGTASGLESYIAQMKQYDKPLWLTEFSSMGGGCATDATTESAYMAAALPYLEGEPAVERYAWFTGRFSSVPGVNLLAASGQLTALGQQYVSAPQACGK